MQTGAEGIAVLTAMSVFMLFPIFVFVLMLCFMAFWIWMLVDAATNDGLVGNDKLIWVLIVLLANWIGAIVYFCAARSKRFDNPPAPQPPGLP